MAITIGLANGGKITIKRDTATIGRGPGVDVAIASTELQSVHARIIQVAGRWMVEAAGDWLLQVGDSVPGRKQWLEPDQVIWLTESGDMVVFEPRLSHDHQPSVVEDAGMCLEEEGLGGSIPTGSSSQLSPLPRSPSFPPPLASTNPLPLPACYAKAVGATVEFRGRGTIMIGRGTATFTGKRHLGPGQWKPGSLIVPLSDVANVNADKKRVAVAFMLGNALARLMLDAASADEAKHIATALERDALGEMQRKRTEASGHYISTDPSPPRCFTVVYESDPSQE
jgi:hypothetical protein